jgi:hypothetical protein
MVCEAPVDRVVVGAWEVAATAMKVRLAKAVEVMPAEEAAEAGAVEVVGASPS